MAEIFKTVLTAKGLEKLAAASATGVALDLFQIAVGDGNGSYYEPAENQTALKNEVARFELNTLIVEADNKKRWSAEILIPESSGGYMIREAGLFDRAGELIAVAKIPETFKPSVESGAGSQLYFKMIGEFTNDVNLTITINPRQLFVTDDVMRNFIKSDVYTEVDKRDSKVLADGKKYTNDELDTVDNVINSHVTNRSNPHGVTKAQVGLGNADNTADREKAVLRAYTLETLNVAGGTHGGAHLLKCQYSKDSDGLFKLFVDGFSTKVDVANMLRSSNNGGCLTFPSLTGSGYYTLPPNVRHLLYNCWVMFYIATTGEALIYNASFSSADIDAQIALTEYPSYTRMHGIYPLCGSHNVILKSPHSSSHIKVFYR